MSGKGWAMPRLLESSSFLRASALQATGESLTEALAAALAHSLPEPRPSQADMLAAGEAMQAVLQQSTLTTTARAVFLAPYSASIAALSPAALLALLRVHQHAALQAPSADFLAACLAQRYASLAPAQFQAEVGGPCPAWAGLAKAWWEAHFGEPAALPSPLCSCAQAVSLSWTTPLPTLAFGLLPDSPAAEYWARGMVCPYPHTPACCSALLALTMGHAAWLEGAWPAAGAAADRAAAARQCLSPADSCAARTALLTAALSERPGAGCPVLAHLCCMLLWGRAEDCPPSQLPVALHALEGALSLHPDSAFMIHASCAAVARLACAAPDTSGTLPHTLATLTELLQTSCLPAAARGQAAAALVSVLGCNWQAPCMQPSQARLLPARLAALLEWDSLPLVQLAATRALSRWRTAHLSALQAESSTCSCPMCPCSQWCACWTPHCTACASRPCRWWGTWLPAVRTQQLR